MKNQVQNLLWIILVLVSFTSCIKEEPQISYKLKTFNYILLQYDELDKNSYFYVPHTNVVWDKDYNGKITLQYNEQNQIIGTNYGGTVFSIGTNQNYISFAKANIDKIQFDGDIVNTENCLSSSNYSDTIKYILKNGKLIEREVFIGYFKQKFDYSYQYENDKIIEKLNGLQTTIFYLTNGNVTKIEKFQYNNSKEIIYKTEITYSDYDQSINLLKGYYYIHGAFYKAFSTNNYKKREANTYSCNNNQYTQISTSSRTFDYKVDSNNIPDMFEYETY